LVRNILVFTILLVFSGKDVTAFASNFSESSTAFFQETTTTDNGDKIHSVLDIVSLVDVTAADANEFLQSTDFQGCSTFNLTNLERLYIARLSSSFDDGCWKSLYAKKILFPFHTFW